MNESTILSGNSFAAREYDRLPPRVWWLGALMVAIGLVAFFLISTKANSDGYLYLFFYSIPANTAISVFPHEPILIYYGTLSNSWIAWCIAALAATGGTIVAGLLDHQVFVPVLNLKRVTSYKQSRFYEKSTAMFMRYPFATIVATGFTPIPFWPFKLLAFSIHYPLPRYLAALTLARFPRYYLLAWLGAAIAIPTWVLIGIVALIFATYAIRGIPMLWRHLRKKRPDYVKDPGS